MAALFSCSMDGASGILLYGEGGFRVGQGAAADEDLVGGGLYDGFAVGVDEAEFGKTEGEVEMLCFAGGEGNALEGFELADGLLDGGCGVAEVELDNLSASDRAGVGEVDADGEGWAAGEELGEIDGGVAYCGLGVAEACVAESPAEGEEGFVFLVEVAGLEFFAGIDG